MRESVTRLVGLATVALLPLASFEAPLAVEVVAAPVVDGFMPPLLKGKSVVDTVVPGDVVPGLVVVGGTVVGAITTPVVAMVVVGGGRVMVGGAGVVGVTEVNVAQL